MTMLTAFYILLYRYTGQTDLLVGAPTAGRSRYETEGLIGLFLNTLALRVNLAGQPTFCQLLGRVRQVCLAAYAHQDLPFELVVEAVQPQRDLSRQPIFQVMFDLQPAPLEALQLPGLTVSQLNLDLGGVQFDLALSLEQSRQGLTGVIEYSTDLFDSATIARLAGHYHTLLAGLVAQPNQRLADLPLLTPAEERQLLVDWNNTVAAAWPYQCFHHLVEAHARHTPEATALCFVAEDQTVTCLTYADLNGRANQLAYYLHSLGIRSESRVGVCLERSIEAVIALLAVLKAGAVYLPLTPAHPPERLAFIMADAQIKVLITQEWLRPHLSPTNYENMPHLPVISLDIAATELAAQPLNNPGRPITADNLAYLLYTSGSTGQPKGAMITHRGLANISQESVSRFGLRSTDRIPQIASLNFDASILEITMTLAAGAVLCLGSDPLLQPGAALQSFLIDQAISVAFFTPALLPTLSTQALPSLRTVIVGGEATPVELAQHWAANRQLFNAYGPTEITVYAACYTYDDNQARLPIGRPIANTQIYLLDAHLRLVPVGVSGELCIAGVGLARGYLNQPGLTAEKFIPNPFSREPGTRLYRTGDLARYLPDGNIEFLGRIDHQVKIRGFRIELGEIEHQLNRHPAVQDAMVVLREDTPGNKRLVAYLIPSGTETPLPADLTHFLKDNLPDYMLPSAFVSLPAWPLTPNGKLDRRALPPPASPKPGVGDYVAPRNPIEEVMADLWANLLRLERVGIHHNFFELGGHSLLATQLLVQTQKTFQVDLPLRCLFESPTVAGLAETLLEHEARPGQTAKIARLRQQIKRMSPKQIQTMLQEKKKG
jgi:amino acid adenylation domain-containing protein